MTQPVRHFHHRSADGKTVDYHAAILKREGAVIEGTTPSPEYRHAMRTHFIIHLAPGESFIEVLEVNDD